MATDWQVMENEYVTTDISLQGLADKHGAVLRTVARWSKKGEWARKRAEYVTNVSLKCHQIMADHDVVAILSQRQKILAGYADIMVAYENAARKLAMNPEPEMKDVNEGLKAVANSHAADALFFGTGEDNRIILELDPELDEYAK